MIKQILKPNTTILNIKDISMDISGRNLNEVNEKTNSVSTRPIVYYYNVQIPAIYNRNYNK